jgi:hypothetical protein
VREGEWARGGLIVIRVRLVDRGDENSEEQGPFEVFVERSKAVVNMSRWHCEVGLNELRVAEINVMSGFSDSANVWSSNLLYRAKAAL